MFGIALEMAKQLYMIQIMFLFLKKCAQCGITSVMMESLFLVLSSLVPFFISKMVLLPGYLQQFVYRCAVAKATVRILEAHVILWPGMDFL